MATRFVTAGVTDLTTIGLVTGEPLVFRDGSQTITGVDMTAGPAVASIVNWVIPTTFSGLIGSGSGIGLPVTGYIRNQGGGIFNYYPTASTCARFVQLGPSTTNLFSGAITRLEVKNGAVNIYASCTVPTLVMSGGVVNATYIGTTSDYQNLDMSGGTLISERGMDSNFSGATMTIAGGYAKFARINSSTNLPVATTGSANGVFTVTGTAQVNWQGGDIDTLRGGGTTASIDFGSIQQNITINNLIATKDFIDRSNFAPAGFTITITSKTISAGENDNVP